ncbi:MAG: DNA primase [Candidatus Woesebacteria bacterium]|jgi:DNA primase
MADQVEEVKSKVDIVSVVGDYVDLKKAGRNYKALCPFHSEKTPSFMVSPELQIYKCFGCGASGDVISFLQEYEGMDFYEALKHLAERAGVKLKPTSYRGKSEKEKFYKINNLANKFYHYILLNHPSGKKALSYLKKQRGLKVDTIKTFQLGFSPDVPFAIGKYLLDKKGFEKKDIEEAGITFTKNTKSFDRFRGRVIFPLFDHRGNTIGFAGRIMPQDKNKDLAKYINTPETAVYHKSKVLYGLNQTKAAIKRKGVAVVVEGELDLISSWQVGVENIVAIKGSAFTQEQANLLSRFAKMVVLAMDADLAGDSSARRGIEIAEAADLEVEVARIEKYKDPDDMARKDPKGLKKTLKNPVGVWDFIVDSILSKHDLRSGEGKAKVSKEVVPTLASIQDNIVRAHYIEKIARKLSVPTDAVVEQVSKFKSYRKKETPKVAPIKEKQVKSRGHLLEERLMSLYFHTQPEELLEKQIKALFDNSFSQRIIEEVQRHLDETDEFDLNKFRSSLPAELVEGFSDLVLKGFASFTDEAEEEIDYVSDEVSPSSERLQKEIEFVKNRLEAERVKESLKETAEKIKEYEEDKKSKKLKGQQEKFNKLTKKLSELESKLNL